jgi:hypothetical protein
MQDEILNLEVSTLSRFWNPKEKFEESLRKMFYLALCDSLWSSPAEAFDIALKAAVAKATKKDKQWLLKEKRNLNRVNKAVKTPKALKQFKISELEQNERAYALIDLWHDELTRFRKEQKALKDKKSSKVERSK